MITEEDGSIGSKVALLQQYGDSYAAKIRKEQLKIDSITDKIKDVQIRIEQSRKQIRDSHGQRQSAEDMGRKIKSLENRLDKQLQKFNQAVAQNKRLRQEIDSARKEKAVFESIYQKLNAELLTKKEKLMRILKKAEAAFVTKEQTAQELQQLKREAQRDVDEFAREKLRLSQTIQKDKQIRDFIKAKEEHKAQLGQLAQQQKPRAEESGPARQDNLNELTNQEKALKKQVSALAW